MFTGSMFIDSTVATVIEINIYLSALLLVLYGWLDDLWSQLVASLWFCTNICICFFYAAILMRM